MKHLLYIFILLTVFNANHALAKHYEIPPSGATSSHVPYISDEAMEECVKIYNQAKWLADDINTTQVNSYSQVSVDSYNEKITRHGKMTDAFNRDCAGKQSESAYRAAQELNRRNN